jgi:Protein of unknown function (DUF2971)
MSYEAKPQYLMDPLNNTQELEEVISDFYESWLTFHSRNENIKLYHYTNLDGLQGILNKRMLWSSHTGSFNDPAELQYGKDLIVSELTQKKNVVTHREIQTLLEELISLIKIYDTVFYHNYVTCFCESGNLLSQWRGYADSGGGYSIGLEFSPETSFYHQINNFQNSSYMILRKVEYELEKQKEWISSYIAALIEASGNAIARFEKSANGIPNA